MTSQVAIIIGMHRSGTSVLTRAVRSMGFELGENLLEPNDENIKGFYENQAIVSFNDRLLCHMDLSWDSIGFVWEEDFNAAKYEELVAEARYILQDNFKDAPLWAVKDPRLCILLPFWKKVLKSLGAPGLKISYILCLRNPLESFYSQNRRHKLDPSFHIVGSNLETFLLMWYTNIRKAILSIDPDRCICVSYERLLEKPKEEYKRIASFLSIEPNTEAIETFANSYIDQGLKHNNANIEDFIRKSERVKFVGDMYFGLKQKDTSEVIPGQYLRQLINSTVEFDNLNSLYLTHVQRLYGKLYHQHLQTRRMSALEKQKTMELETKLRECQNLYRMVIDSRRWRFITTLCRFIGR